MSLIPPEPPGPRVPRGGPRPVAPSDFAFLSVLDFGNGPVLNNPSATKTDVFLARLEP